MKKRIDEQWWYWVLVLIAITLFLLAMAGMFDWGQDRIEWGGQT